FGGRTIDTGAWVEGPGFFHKVWWQDRNRKEAWFILSATPIGTEERVEIKPESFRIEIDGAWYTREEVSCAVKYMESL
ncbi:MAG: hypothetical protein WC279_13765, partial [Sulfurimonas sp.]|uniref:hypothetical protein n=1 Tax=Sulfurimonas sp. TaxID=2022749 RepID=UPI003566F1D1